MTHKIFLFDRAGLIGEESADSESDALEVAIAYISSGLAIRSQIRNGSGLLVSQVPHVLNTSFR